MFFILVPLCGFIFNLCILFYIIYKVESNTNSDSMEDAVDVATKRHEVTLLKLRIYELEDNVEQLKLDKDRWELVCTMLRQELANLKHEVRRWAGRPTKDGRSILLDLVNKGEK